jgi:hypothetical protein
LEAQVKRAVLTLLVLGLVLVACGDKDKESDGLRGEQPCVGVPSPIADPRFPSGFPSIGDVTWTASQTAGPTQVVKGYTGDAIDDLFREMKEKFSEGGYSVSKSERDAHDAEVNFQSSGYTGQVVLADECRGRTSVRVAIRPT